MLSNELFFKAELNKKFGLKTSIKWPGAPVIDILKYICEHLVFLPNGSEKQVGSSKKSYLIYIFARTVIKWTLIS